MDEQRNEYRTGRTEPRQKHSGVITFLLILVIFLCGLVSVLGVLNVHLFRLLDTQDNAPPLAFSQREEPTPTETENSVSFAGMIIQEIPEFYQAMHELPAGLYISYVQETSAAGRAGVLAGDVLVNWAGKKLTTLDALRDFLAEVRNGVTITICREGEHTDLILEVGGK